MALKPLYHIHVLRTPDYTSSSSATVKINHCSFRLARHWCSSTSLVIIIIIIIIGIIIIIIGIIIIPRLYLPMS